MIALRKIARAAALAALALLGAAAAHAQPAAFVPSEDDAILLQIQVRKYRLVGDIRGYGTPDGACVDLADVIQSLDLPIRLDRKSRRATGWIFSESQSFAIDRDSNMVQTMNISRPLQPGEIYDTPEGWCVDSDALSGWLGVTFDVNLRDAVLVLESERPLPFLDALERRSRAARLRPDRETDLSRYPQAAQPYALWRMPSVDVVAQSEFRSGGGASRARTRYEVLASGELAQASFDLRLASDFDGEPESARLRAYRMDPDGGLLGPIRATQAMAGDVELLSGELAGAQGVGRGLFISNRALQRPSRFGTTILRGSLPVGWDAELYRNGQLLAFQGDGQDGRYEFEVPLIYGSNDIEIVLYGPQGQLRRESQSIPVGQGAVPPGGLEYWTGAIQSNRDLIAFGPGPAGDENDAWQYAAGLQYGLDRRTVIGASGHSLVLDSRRRDYGEVNLQRAIGSMLLNLTAAQELSRGRAYHADLLGRIGAVNIQAESFFVAGEFTSGLVGEDERNAHRVQADTVVRAGRMVVPLTAAFHRSGQRGGRETDEWLIRASLILPRVALTGFVLRRDSRRGIDDGEDGTRIGLLANTRFLGLTARGEASYRLDGAGRGFESARVTLEKALDDRSDLRVEIERESRRGATAFEAGYVRHFRRFDLRAGAGADTRGGVSASLAVGFSFGPDPLRGGWHVSSNKLAQRGQAAVAVFLDQNGDGLRAPDEPALEGVGINAGQHGAADPTDAAGHAFVEGLQPYDRVLVSVDESTLPDPFWVVREKGMVVLPRPGVTALVELAVSPTGEVEGVLVSPEGTALAGVGFELVTEGGELVAATLSEYDGFFLFERVVYGRYSLRLADDSARALGLAMPPELAGSIELGPSATVKRLGTLRLLPALTVAQARGPPEESDAGRDKPRERLDPVAIPRVEPRGEGAVEVDDGDRRAFAQDGDDQFRTARRVASDVAGEGVHVLDELALAARGGGAAHSAAERDADARGLAAERAEHQLSAHEAVEPGPVEIGHELPDRRGDVGHVGDGVWLVTGQRVGGGEQFAIEFRRGQASGDGEVVHPDRVAADSVAAKRPLAYRAGMSMLKKIAIGLAVVVLLVVVVGWWILRGDPADLSLEQVSGTDPELAEPAPQTIPTVAVAKPIGWEEGAAPTPGEGLAVNRFADGLEHPRVIYTMPNGDVLVSESNAPERVVAGGGAITNWIAGFLFRRAGASVPSPNKVVLLRDADGDGTAEERHELLTGLSSPSGLAWHDGKLYVANHDALLRFDYAEGADAVSGGPVKLVDLPPAGNHWMRNIVLSPDGTKLYIAIGSASNIADSGIEAEQNRAAVHEFDLASGTARLFGQGMRNPNGLAWNPWNGELWVTVNERDQLGSDLVPDYLTNVPIGVNYGWPWVYWGDVIDERVEAPMPEFLTNYTRTPEYALGPHVAALGLTFTREGSRMGTGFAQGAFVARHGSWNRKPRAGYDVVFVQFDERGNPKGQPVPVLGGFLAGGETHGRPTWVAWDRTGALLVSDDTGNVIWRVVAPGAEPAAAPKRAESDHLPPQLNLETPRPQF